MTKFNILASLRAGISLPPERQAPLAASVTRPRYGRTFLFAEVR